MQINTIFRYKQVVQLKIPLLPNCGQPNEGAAREAVSLCTATAWGMCSVNALVKPLVELTLLLYT